MASSPRARRSPLPLLLLAGIGALLLLLPLAGLLIRVPWADAWSALHRGVVLDALRLSLLCASLAALLSLLVGVPLAWVLARSQLPGKRLLRALLTVPLVLPPVVGGVALLVTFGRRGVLGQWLGAESLPFTTAGVVLAEAFVAMPFLVVTVESALRSQDGRLQEAAATLGLGPWRTFWRVDLPQARTALIAGTTLCWARALGEFGATVTFAGNLRGVTQTLPLATYISLESDPPAALVLSVLLLGVSLVVITGLRGHWLPGARR
jgi:molybdate transport system permease protein